MARTWLAIILCFAQASYGLAQATAASSKPVSSEKILVTDFSGKAIAGIFALTCSEKNWNSFATWARSSGFAQIQHKVNVEVDLNFTDKLANVNGQDMTIKNDSSGGLEARINGMTYRGEDSCDLMLKVSRARLKPKATAWTKFLLQSALAEDLVTEDKSSENWEIGLGLGLTVFEAGLGVSSAGLLSLSTIGGIFYGYSLFQEGLQRRTTMTDYESFLNNDFEFSCGKKTMTLRWGKKSILVTQKPWQTVMKDNDITIHTNEQSEVAEASKLVLHSLARKCQSDAEAAALNTLFHDQRLKAEARAVALNRYAPIPDSVKGSTVK
jgi:hypothetical protein